MDLIHRKRNGAGQVSGRIRGFPLTSEEDLSGEDFGGDAQHVLEVPGEDLHRNERRFRRRRIRLKDCRKRLRCAGSRSDAQLHRNHSGMPLAEKPPRVLVG